jgi:hypothetical protein
MPVQSFEFILSKDGWFLGDQAILRPPAKNGKKSKKSAAVNIAATLLTCTLRLRGGDDLDSPDTLPDEFYESDQSRP